MGAPTFPRSDRQRIGKIRSEGFLSAKNLVMWISNTEGNPMPRAAERTISNAKQADALKPEAKTYRCAVDGASGLKLVVEAGGRKWWQVRYVTADGKESTKAIGTFPALGIAPARDMAARLRHDIRHGGADPAQDRRRARGDAERRRLSTLAGVFQEWQAACRSGVYPPSRAQPKKESSLKFELETFRTHWADIGARPVAEVTAGEIQSRLDDVAGAGRRGAARNALSVMASLMAFAEDRGLVADRPTRKIPRIRPASRAVVASDDDLHRLWWALEACAYPDDEPRPVAAGKPYPGDPRRRSRSTALAVMLSILTMQRRAEVIGARASEFDLSRMVWTMPADRRKEGRANALPIAPWAGEIIRDALSRSGRTGFLFPSAVVAGRHLDPHSLTLFLGRMRRWFSDNAEPLSVDVTPHDLRRTVRTAMTDDEGNESGAITSGEIAERIMGHKVGNDVRATYDRNAYLRSKREALEGWERRLAEIVRKRTI
jgi:integrase